MKKIKLICFILILTSAISYSQQKTQPGCTKHLAISAKMNFEESLKTNSLIIYLRGGIVSVITDEDKKFEKSYGIKYHDFGCVLPENLKFYESYNHYVFNHLKEKFGNDWKKSINKNAFGVNNLTL